MTKLENLAAELELFAARIDRLGNQFEWLEAENEAAIDGVWVANEELALRVSQLEDEALVEGEEDASGDIESELEDLWDFIRNIEKVLQSVVNVQSRQLNEKAKGEGWKTGPKTFDPFSGEY